LELGIHALQKAIRPGPFIATGPEAGGSRTPGRRLLPAPRAAHNSPLLLVTSPAQHQPRFPMNAKPVLFTIAAAMLFSCSSAPTATQATPAPDSSTVAPTDTVINRYERKEVKEIQRDTTKVQEAQ
jgi:hypothetical protein